MSALNLRLPDSIHRHIREIAKRFLDKAKSLDSNISIDPIQWGKSVKFKGSVLFYWEPRQTCIRISTTNPDGDWEGFNVVDDKGFEIVFTYIRNNVSNMI